MEKVMKFQVNDNGFQLQKCLNCVTLLLSLFEFIIKKKCYTWNSTLTNFLLDALVGFVPLIPHIGIFVRTYGFEIFENKCLIWNQHHHSLNPPSSFTRGDGRIQLFLNWWICGMGRAGGWTFLKKWGKAVVILYWGFSGNSSWCS